MTSLQDAIVTLIAAAAAWSFMRQVFVLNRPNPRSPQCASCPKSARR
jgi:hypothetical protein